jgi:ribosomal protein S8
LKIDNNLYTDMRAICSTEDGVSKKVCRRVAKVYYKAVRKYGKDAKMVQREVERGLAMVESEAGVNDDDRIRGH